MSHHLDQVTTPARIWQPTPVAPAAELELYPVPVPASVPVVLPDGRTAWAREVAPRLEAAPMPAQAVPMPAWAKGLAVAAAALSGVALSGALALRIAAPALEAAINFLEALLVFAVVVAVVLLGVGIKVRTGRRAAVAPGAPVMNLSFGDITAGAGGTGGRWLSRGGQGGAVHLNITNQK
ncbi:hypothetical protein ACIQV3_35870 [Streptomyces sp. NPDC099050]|uniref:hypothetical protein n=1 Tax=Streptomyces sp. NPDC099050 TaxID=3366100 RepID=UPI003817D86B